MVASQATRREAYLNKTRAELEGLAGRGVIMGGNAFSSVLMVKGELSGEERGGAKLLSGDDGQALHKALEALGYEPGDGVVVAAVLEDGTPLAPALLREAVAALGPGTVLALDDRAADLVRDAYADELAGIEEIDVALLKPGLVARAAGMRLMSLGNFAAALDDPKLKQWVWACLKRVPPLGEPY